MELITGATFVVAIQLGIVTLLNLGSQSVSNRLLGGLLLIFFLSAKYFLLDYLPAGWFFQLVQGIPSSPFYGPLAYLFLLSLLGRPKPVDYLAHLTFPILLVLFYLANDAWVILDQHLLIKVHIVIEFGVVLVYSLFALRFFRLGRLAHIKIQRRYRLFFAIIFVDLLYNFGELGFAIYLPKTHSALMPGLFQFDMLVYLLLFVYLTLFALTELHWIRKHFVPKSIYLSPGHKAEEDLGIKLRIFFEEEQLHLDPNLTMQKLAKALGVSRTILSEYLIIKEKSTFNEMVNGYRLESFKKKLGDPQYAHLDIIGVAFAAGFGSKATFYRVFKKKEGVTPSQYVKNLN